MRLLLVLLLLPLSIATFAQTQPDHSHRLGRVIQFPDIPGYKTVKCDLHMHTVFSDGTVWPTIRVQEALMDGMDAISLTEHLEYQPHKDDIPHPDRNRSYNLALAEAKDHDLIIIRGSEITRKMPPGHNNAVFVTDANKMLVSDSIGVFREAKRQGAFTFWNHPAWTSQRPDGMATLTPMHQYLIKEKLLDGIEVVNDDTYSDEALKIALDNNLTIMGTSDIHGLVDWQFVDTPAKHRPITLVFAKEKTEAGIKDALFNKRTVAFYKNLLIGRDEFLVPIIQESLVIKSATYLPKTNVLSVVIENRSNAEFTLRNKSAFTITNSHDVLTIQPGDANILEVKTKDKLTTAKLTFEVLNAVNAPASHPTVSWVAVVK